MSNVDDFLMGGGGAPSAKFDTIGRTYKGTILKSEMRQQTDISGTPKNYDDGNPMMQAVITIQTDERDSSIEDDDGQRRLFVKGNMQKAVRDAIVASRCSTLALGGTLAVRYTGDGIPKRAGLSAPKEYVAQYVAPAVGVGDLIASAPAPQAPAPAVASSNGGGVATNLI
jgi:hypothetical protein